MSAQPSSPTRIQAFVAGLVSFTFLTMGFFWLGSGLNSLILEVLTITRFMAYL